MGQDHVRHVRVRFGRYFWEPTRAMRKLGYSSEPLGTDQAKAYIRAVWLNAEADKDKLAEREASGQDLAASAVKRLVALFERSEDFPAGKRTRKDYSYWLGFVIATFGKFPVEAIEAKAIKLWLKETAKHSAWNAYHIGLTFRTFLKWCAAEGYMGAAPEFEVTTPPARKVQWKPEQILAEAEALAALGWPSLAVGFLVEWCIGQNPCDVWSLKRSAYAAKAIDVTRSKTGVGGDPIPLWPDIAQRLDAYLADSPALPDAALFRNEKTGIEWKESTRAKWFARAREKADLPRHLQMRDLRRTAITEALRAGFTRGQARSLSRHATEQGMEPYDALASSGQVIDVQRARNRVRQTQNKP